CRRARLPQPTHCRTSERLVVTTRSRPYQLDATQLHATLGRNLRDPNARHGQVAHRQKKCAAEVLLDQPSQTHFVLRGLRSNVCGRCRPTHSRPLSSHVSALLADLLELEVPMVQKKSAVFAAAMLAVGGIGLMAHGQAQPDQAG